MDIAKITACPDCASTNIVHSQMRDQVICKDCGLIFEQFTPVDTMHTEPQTVLTTAPVAPVRKTVKKTSKKAVKKPAKAVKKKTAKKRR